MLTHIKETINKKARDLAGTFIECKFCKDDARITLEDRRWKINCYTCSASYYLKTQHSLEAPRTPLEEV